MNVRLLQLSLIVALLAAGVTSLPVRAECNQQELCEAQLVVSGLLGEIVEHRDVIDVHRKMLGSAQDRGSLSEWYERSVRLVDMVSRYLHIGTLESRLLLAHDKLGLVRMELGPHDTVCHCSDKIQLSAR